jgi:hypothetical protein
LTGLFSPVAPFRSQVEWARSAPGLQLCRRKQAQFRAPLKTLDNFAFTFDKEINRSLVFELATGAFIARDFADKLLNWRGDRFLQRGCHALPRR